MKKLLLLLESNQKPFEMLENNKIDTIVIGNGTASDETYELITNNFKI